MAVFSVPKEILHIRTDGYNVLYNPEMHSWDYLTDEELVLYRSIQKNGSIDHLRFSRELQTSLFRFVLKGLLYHGTSPPLVEKEKAFPESPSAVYWAITNSCNLHCIYCFADASPSMLRRLNTRQAFAALESILTSNPQWVYFTGGEPLLENDLFDLACFCKDTGVRTGLLTNATLITPRTAQRIACSFDSVAISLDSLTPEIHDALRGPGTHRRTLRGLLLLLEHGVRPAINTTVTRMNIDEIPALANWVRQLGLDEHRLSIHMAVGRGKNDGLGCDESRLLWLLQRVIQQGAWLNLKKTSYSVFQASLPKPFKPKCQCGLGTNELLVDGMGNVFPCRLLCHESFLAGNVLRQPLCHIYNTSRVLLECRTIDVEDIPICRNCNYRYFCGGGCRALAFHATGDITAPLLDMCNVYKREFDFMLAQEPLER
ncbi:MAG TPA: hypothetical protein DCG91_03640 [Clostridiales bacterium UBA9857]|jgi:radical SAM protein with 4Fe4S-binding SPASM domain|nr:radical SAM protein [Candidatus Fermentithermobacillaceae bacterium]HAF66870.1 hypothetical protein [Clostridiales bacterium UBA9857]HQD86023.1 radical SAM protein [Bacillota bacterium]